MLGRVSGISGRFRLVGATRTRLDVVSRLGASSILSLADWLILSQIRRTIVHAALLTTEPYPVWPQPRLSDGSSISVARGK